MNLLHTAIVQQDIVWEDTDKNLKKLDILLKDLNDSTDLVILPEMFHSGFTMNPERVAQTETGKAVRWLKAKAMELDVHIMGSVVFKSGSVYYNRLYIYDPLGEVNYYDKRHLFSIGGEGEHYKAGKFRLIINIKGWRVCPLICYDLRFPVWSRNCNDYDLLIYVANWPKSRREVWSTLLKARAIENQTYVIGVNRIGEDHSNEYSGDSVVLNAKGNSVFDIEKDNEVVAYSRLDLDELNAFRNKFPVWKDADDFKLY